MGDSPSPTILRAQLGQRLRQLAAGAGATPAVVADYLGVSPSTVSKIFNGRQAVRVAQVRSIAALCRLTDDEAAPLIALAKHASQSGWWVEYAATVPTWFKTFLGLEGAADAIRTYELELVPGLLQTPAYTEAVNRATWPSWSDAEVAHSVQFRQARQQHLADDGRTPELHFILNESVLCRPVGGPDVWREQLEHLAEVAGRPHVTLQFLPFAVGAHPVMGSAFTSLRFTTEPTLNTVYLENDRGGHHLKSKTDITRYEQVFDQLSRMAASPEETADELTRLVKHL